MLTIIFDLDDTLYDRKQPIKRAFYELTADENAHFETFDNIYQQNSEIAFRHFTSGALTLVESHIFRIQETMKELGMEISKSDALAFQETYEHHQESIELFPYIKDILLFLKKKEIPIYILTNGPSEHQRKKVKNLRLNLFFSDGEVVVSGEENVAKPNGEIFQIMEQRYQLKKNDIWFIGDSFENDIIGGLDAGWSTIWLNQKEEPSPLQAYDSTKTVHSTKELKQFVEDLISQTEKRT